MRQEQGKTKATQVVGSAVSAINRQAAADVPQSGRHADKRLQNKQQPRQPIITRSAAGAEDERMCHLECLQPGQQAWRGEKQREAARLGSRKRGAGESMSSR